MMPEDCAAQEAPEKSTLSGSRGQPAMLREFCFTLHGVFLYNTTFLRQEATPKGLSGLHLGFVLTFHERYSHYTLLPLHKNVSTCNWMRHYKTHFHASTISIFRHKHSSG